MKYDGVLFASFNIFQTHKARAPYGGQQTIHHHFVSVPHVRL